jgi:hypothetical protein
MFIEFVYVLMKDNSSMLMAFILIKLHQYHQTQASFNHPCMELTFIIRNKLHRLLLQISEASITQASSFRRIIT